MHLEGDPFQTIVNAIFNKNFNIYIFEQVKCVEINYLPPSMPKPPGQKLKKGKLT